MTEKPDNPYSRRKKQNMCDIDMGQDPETCWCQEVQHSTAALDALPDDEVGVRCICQVCATSEAKE